MVDDAVGIEGEGMDEDVVKDENEDEGMDVGMGVGMGVGMEGGILEELWVCRWEGDLDGMVNQP